tara:strand:- start:343 stop:738 length:396 start_codon:yes stop_codon:yes gene_type:complete
MNSIIYRKIILNENWQENQFIMIKKKVNVPKCPPLQYSINFQMSHPKILSEEAYWVSHNELCIGYHSATNPDIFRPVFSYRRQNLLDKLHSNINNPNLRYARKKYLIGLDNKKILPVDCVEIILSFIHSNL